MAPALAREAVWPQADLLQVGLQVDWLLVAAPAVDLLTKQSAESAGSLWVPLPAPVCWSQAELRQPGSWQVERASHWLPLAERQVVAHGARWRAGPQGQN